MNMAKKMNLGNPRFDADHIITATLPDGRHLFGAATQKAAHSLINALRKAGATDIEYRYWQNGAYRAIIEP